MTQTANPAVRQPYYVNEQGEVIDELNQEQHLTVINPLNPGNMLPSVTNLPLHYQALKLDQLSDEEAEKAIDMLHTYTQVIPSDLKVYANTVINILGAVLKQNQEYNSKPVKLPDGSMSASSLQPGYYNVLIKLDKTTTDELTGEVRNVILKSSSKTVAEVMVSIMALRGFGDWKTPYKALVKVAANNQQFLQRAVETKKTK